MLNAKGLKLNAFSRNTFYPNNFEMLEIRNLAFRLEPSAFRVLSGILPEQQRNSIARERNLKNFGEVHN
jgi:hypothetical protein